MRTRRDHHASAGQRGRSSARWRGVGAVVAAAALSLAAGAVPASPPGGYTVTATIPVGHYPFGVAVDPSTHTVYVTNEGADTVSVISAALSAPVTTVTSSQNPSTFGQDVTFTATVSPADGGTITFSTGSKALCRAVPVTHVSGSTYQATCTTTALPAGPDTITAAYPGDASYATSAGTLTQTVTRARTALTARIGLSPHLALTLTATLTASGRPLRGQSVSFSTGHTHLCTPHTGTRGVATCVLTAAQAGQHHGTIRARYPGNTSYQPSSATAAPPWWWPGLLASPQQPAGQRTVRSADYCDCDS
jgi:DNA-binding beta-propeller fold protein YncE